eukprot:267504_1
MSYYAVFINRMQDTNIRNCCGPCCIFLIAFPFSFLLPYLIYFYESPYMCDNFSSYIKSTFRCYGHVIPKELLDIITNNDDENFNLDLIFKDILKEKINCHIGFILETFIESFPQAIIQMIAILQISGSDTDNTTNIIIVTSIFLSLLSIAFKSIMLLAVADLWTSTFNWTSAVVDFFNVFVIVSWLFLEITENNGITSTTNLQYFILCLIIITTVPFYACFIGFLLNQMIDFGDWCICGEICVFIVLLSVSVTIGHICCCMLLVLYVKKFGLHRFNDSKKGAYWAQIFKFIHESSSNHDKLMKILCINKVLYDEEKIHNTEEDIQFGEWLDKHKETYFMDVGSFNELRDHIHRDDFFKQITFSENLSRDKPLSTYGNRKHVEWDIVCEKFWEISLSYIGLPLYLFGRTTHLLFPIIIYVINLFIFGIDGIHLLHHV